MIEINAEKYQVSYTAETAVVTFTGSLLLNGASAYESILQLLKDAACKQDSKQLIIDIRELKFLNSSGINMMTKFIMYIADSDTVQLGIKVCAYKKIAWQARLAINLQRLMPALQAELVE